MSSAETDSLFDEVADRAVALGNEILDANPDADAWEIASGMLSGVVHFWLYTHQPCADPSCRSCAEMATAELRLQQLVDEVRESAEESTYFHSPFDRNVGNA
ncbi:hypothetical protein [Immundisolibacter sp.]|uniref:hypothetical protein n=1 Tax=Immundisolibacter sp. TaxID=1934948 RepID=UPI00356B4514